MEISVPIKESMYVDWVDASAWIIIHLLNIMNISTINRYFGFIPTEIQYNTILATLMYYLFD